MNICVRDQILRTLRPLTAFKKRPEPQVGSNEGGWKFSNFENVNFRTPIWQTFDKFQSHWPELSKAIDETNFGQRGFERVFRKSKLPEAIQWLWSRRAPNTTENTEWIKWPKSDSKVSRADRPQSLVAHDCGYPLSRYTCRAARVAADFLDFYSVLQV